MLKPNDRYGRQGSCWALSLLCLAAAGAAADEAWLCEATTGTAYEYDAAADHWQTKLFAVDQRWRFEPPAAGDATGWRALSLTEPLLGLECAQRTDSRGEWVLACGENGWISMDLGLQVLSVALPADATGRQRARTAVGRCRPADCAQADQAPRVIFQGSHTPRERLAGRACADP